MSHWETPGQSDEWYTPKYVMDALGCRFDLDVAAPFDGPLHVPCDGWLYDRGLEREWTGFVWMNPPFGGRNSLEPWLDKFFAHGNGIALTPDRTSAPWWQAAFRRSDALLHVSKKIRFLRPDGSEGKSPSNGTTLFAVGSAAIVALLEADLAGLGMYACPWQRKVWGAAA
jgi:hypothetical protein